eukprot:485519-Rhodomonas_salina.1
MAAPFLAWMSASSFSPISACAFSQKACVSLVCLAAISTSVCSAGRMRWLYGDCRKIVLCQACRPCSRALVSQPHHNTSSAC